MELQFKKKRGKRWPLKDEPLRDPGQSLRERHNELVDKMRFPVIVAVIFIAVTLREWLALYNPQPPSLNTCIFLTIATGLFVVYAVWRIRGINKKLRRVKQGYIGEKAVGQELEKLRAKGYRIFHDIQANGFNVDHVIIGPAGIFAVETKMFSIPPGRRAEVRFKEQELTVNGRPMDRDPVRQAKAQSAWMHGVLKESTGRSYFVKPVILFPGWWVEPMGNENHDLWVLNPKALPGFIEKEPTKLGDEDIQLATYHLSRYIRAGERYYRVPL